MKTNFNGYVPRTYSWGTSLSREKYKLRANWNYRGRARNTLITGRSIEPGTYRWDSKRLYLDLSGEYALGRRLALFTKLLGKPQRIARAGCKGLYPDDAYEVVIE